MGCDIHMIVEVKRGGKWEHHEELIGIYDGRNYSLFAMLANVRNGSGFAGCDIGDGFIPIDMPRGLPDNLSAGLGPDSLILGDHSFSWLLVQELLDYDWNQVTNIHGIVDEETYIKWRDSGCNGRPDGWCGGVGGPNIVVISEEDMQTMLSMKPLGFVRDNKEYYCQIEWERLYREEATIFLKNTLPILEALGDPKEVRIVFGFDS